MESISADASRNVAICVVDRGVVLMDITLVPSDAYDAVIRKIILDEFGDPILDVNGQYLIGG